MSIECGECEMDLRSGHADDCSRKRRPPPTPAKRKVLAFVGKVRDLPWARREADVSPRDGRGDG